MLVAVAALVVLARGGGRFSALEPETPLLGSSIAPGLAPPLGPALPDLDAATRRAARFLLTQQSPDGSWRSEEYAVLRSGQAYTPFVLHALLARDFKRGQAPPAAIAKAVAFIRKQVSPEGALGYGDQDLLEYPVYATSYAVRALAIAAPEDPLVAKMAAWLAAMQLAEAKGFEPASPAYGAWSFGALTPRGTPGHVDLAHTRRALEALRDAKASSPEVRDRALRFLGLVQKQPAEIARFAGVPGFEANGADVPEDGGFFFSPVVLVANKALWEKPAGGRAAYFRSYATATADGALALLAAGVASSDPRVDRARRWLESHAAVDLVGIPADHPEPWVAALRYYHLASFCEAAAALDLRGDWRERFTKRLLALQREDGSFVNDASPLMKENDPILATTFALVAMRAINDSRP
jgi:hypothetical protein